MPLLARSPSTNRKYPPLPVDKLEEEINRRTADDNKLFREEFNVGCFALFPCLASPTLVSCVLGLGQRDKKYYYAGSGCHFLVMIFSVPVPFARQTQAVSSLMICNCKFGEMKVVGVFLFSSVK